MDIEKFTMGKQSGTSKIELQGASTLLISWPGGFDPDTGAALPLKEQGFQPTDLEAMRENAARGVVAAEEALAKAQAHLAAFDTLLADPVVIQAKIGIKQ